VTLSGHGVFSPDPDSPRILWWWWDDVGHPPLAPSSGRLTEAGDLVFEKTTERGRRRDTFFGSGSRLVHRIEFAPAGTRELALFVDANYELRAPTGTSADAEARFRVGREERGSENSSIRWHPSMGVQVRPGRQ
jgi:hypothetical protein